MILSSLKAGWKDRSRMSGKWDPKPTNPAIVLPQDKFCTRNNLNNFIFDKKNFQLILQVQALWVECPEDSVLP